MEVKQGFMQLNNSIFDIESSALGLKLKGLKVEVEILKLKV